MDIIRVIVNDKSFKTTKQTLNNSGYFRGILEQNPDVEVIEVPDRSEILFEHVLGYMRNENYPYPGEHWAELQFYLVEKSKDMCNRRDCFELTCITTKGTSSKWCSKHVCEFAHIEKCEDERLNSARYCGTHVCHYSQDCGKGININIHVAKDENIIFSNYCCDHTCIIPACVNQVVLHAHYCIEHICDYPDCGCFKFRNGVCLKHMGK